MPTRTGANPVSLSVPVIQDGTASGARLAGSARHAAAREQQRNPRTNAPVVLPPARRSQGVYRRSSTSTVALWFPMVNADRSVPSTPTRAPSRGAPPPWLTTVSVPVPSLIW